MNVQGQQRNLAAQTLMFGFTVAVHVVDNGGVFGLVVSALLISLGCLEVWIWLKIKRCFRPIMMQYHLRSESDEDEDV